ncbi:CDGSH iron-sulfur domain-containing protein [Pseudonocardia sp. TRM90224]|uniref:CDGSH iron-sulfur domain-containing protein n=1 Tax=Pseudonocardia sp. TRM90224 TaxID=2812678 RepID=UPI001E4B03E1|nr:CDGSH iron-sulfur domain-containing protein [Pseudonocardia sp. TRM90224]
MQPRITVTEHGPYRVEGDVTIKGATGRVLRTEGTSHLCRCGGSRNKPFCDVTHGMKGFDGTEAAPHSSIAQRWDTYPAGEVTVHDDRTVCAHFGQCTTRLPAVFRADAEPFVDTAAGSPEKISDVVAGCPSGALSFVTGTDPAPTEIDHEPSITPIVDGPYRVEGGVEVVSATGEPYERRARQTLCRCGRSRNKPFCDGSHWYAGFQDPQPEEDRVRPPTPFEWAGGMPALRALTTTFYSQLLAEPDPVLEPVFRNMDPGHPEHVAAWLAETLGGPAVYTNEHGGYEHMVSRHRGLALTAEQRERWLLRMMRTADIVGLPADPDFRSTFLAYLEWGTRIAAINSAPDVEPIAHAPVPKWDWGQTPHYVPQRWDDPDAAARGRARYAAEHGERA